MKNRYESHIALPEAVRHEIEDLIKAYFVFFDDDRLDEFVALMTHNAVFNVNMGPDAPEKVKGRDELRAFFGQVRSGMRDEGIQPRHYASNILVTATDVDKVHVNSYVLYTEYYEEDGRAELKKTGFYEFTVCQQAKHQWKIVRWSLKYDGHILPEPKDS